MEIWCIYVDWREIFNSSISHSCSVNAIEFMAFPLLMIIALNHIKKYYFFYVFQNNNNVLSQKFNILNFSFVASREGDGFNRLFLWWLINFINENLIIWLFKYNSSKMQIMIFVIVKTIRSQVADLPTNMRNIATFTAMNLISIRNSLTMTKVSGVRHILSIQE